MHLPVGAKKHLHVAIGEEVRRTVRAVKHGNVPMVQVDRHHIGWQAGHGRCDGNPANVQHVAGAQGTPRMPAKLAECEGGAAAQVQRHVQPAAQRQVGARTSAVHGAEFEHTARLDGV